MVLFCYLNSGKYGCMETRLQGKRVDLQQSVTLQKDFNRSNIYPINSKLFYFRGDLQWPVQLARACDCERFPRVIGPCAPAGMGSRCGMKDELNLIFLFRFFIKKKMKSPCG